jgi:hypothetical protein
VRLDQTAAGRRLARQRTTGVDEKTTPGPAAARARGAPNRPGCLGGLPGCVWLARVRIL